MDEQSIIRSLDALNHSLQVQNSPLLSHPGYPEYLSEFSQYAGMAEVESRISFWPCLDDKTTETPLDLYYFYQDTWAARRIFELSPRVVVDVGSTALLVGIISQHIPTISIDIRPLPVSLPGLTSKTGSITDLPLGDESVELLSSMCVIEHIGLSRYGDELDVQGSVSAFREVSRVIRPGGHFLFSVPVSHTPGVSFNAHRIFSKAQVQALLPDFTVQDELYLFPDPRSESEIATLQGFEFCIWCSHAGKKKQ